MFPLLLPALVDDAFAATSDGSIKSIIIIDDTTENGPDLNNLERFGLHGIANMGDIDGDGVNDIAVGAPYDATGGAGNGAVHIMFMNSGGTVRETVEIDDNTSGITLFDNDWFGWSVANIGDLDDNGVNDLCVGAFGDNGQAHPAPRNRGSVWILLLDSDGSVNSAKELQDNTANAPTLRNSDQFGVSCAGIGDLDEDGVEDIAVGAFKDDAGGGTDTGGSNRGAVHILFMKSNGSIKDTAEINDNTANGPELGNGYWFGREVANIGDVNGDGIDDLAAGTILDPGGGNARGAVHIMFLDRDGSVKETVEIDDTTENGPELDDTDRFGSSIDQIGDIDGNGVNDLVVGAYRDDGTETSNSGSAFILFMKANGVVKSTVKIDESSVNGPDLDDNDQFGQAISAIGDVDGNGVNDFIVGGKDQTDTDGNNQRGTIRIILLEIIIEEEKKGKSVGCGISRDCTAPRITKHGISETPDGFLINDNVFEENQEFFNKNPTIQAKVGEPVTIKLRAWENMGPEKINLVISYLDMYGERPDWRESQAFIEYHIVKNQIVQQDDNGIFLVTGASSEKITNPYGDNERLEVLDITFTIVFAKPMESSHIGIQTIDYMRNYELVYFENALEILPREIVEAEEVVPEDIPEEVVPEDIPEEVVPEPEPPVKEPEPEFVPTVVTEKSVLGFVDENLSAKHYVKRYITEQEYKEWFDVNYPKYQFWEGIGISQDEFEQIKLEIESEPKPKMVQTGFVLVPDEEMTLPLVEETYDPEPPELVKEKKGFWDWLLSLFG